MEANGVEPELLGDSAVMRQLRREIDRAIQQLLARSWPDNVTELKRTIEAAVLRCRASIIGLEDVRPDPLGERTGRS